MLRNATISLLHRRLHCFTVWLYGETKLKYENTAKIYDNVVTNELTGQSGDYTEALDFTSNNNI